ncbi:MAG: Hsp33 family molecular chaperone HslO, partial [Mariprofundaceae bacterium]
HIIAEAARIHGLSDAIAGQFGQVLLGSILLLSINKGGTRQVLQLDALPDAAPAPVQRLLAETAHGSVRGYLNWREEGASMHAERGNTLSEWMGSPVKLSTVRDLGIGQPYVSTIEHDSDFLADHLVHYLHQSVQTRADIVLHGDLAILIEAMPECDDERWFAAVKCLASIPDKALDEQSPEQLLQYFESLGCKPAGVDHYAYRCSCSLEKMRQAVESIPDTSLAELADEQGKVRISCQYCDKFYEVDTTLS